MTDYDRATVIAYFAFYPSKAMTIIGIALFLAGALTTFAVTVKTRQWYMTITSVVGLMEMAGFICRLSFLDSPIYGAYVAMQCLLIIPPSFLALVQYITLGKVVTLVKQRYPERGLLVKPRLVIWVFFTLEVIALACQGAGAGLSVSDKGYDTPHQHVGRILLLIGLSALVALMLAYATTGIYIHCSPKYEIKDSFSMRRLFPVLYTCTSLLLIRNIFRLVEFGQGWEGTIARQEKYFYGFDALMIFLILVVSTPFHFGRYLKAYPYERKQVSPTPSMQMV